MAGVLSIPYVLADGTAFPGRHLIIFLAAGVILFTLVLATMLLPILGEKREEKDTTSYDGELIQSKKKILLVAINGFKQERHKDNETVVYELIKEYRMMFRKMNLDHDYKDSNDYIRKITEVRLIALKAERRSIKEMFLKNQVSMENFEIFNKSMDYKEEVLLNTAGADLKYILGKIRRRLQYLKAGYKEKKIEKMGIGKYIQLKAYRAAITALQELARESEHPSIIQTVIFDYERAVEQLKSTKSEFNEKKEEQREKLRIKIIDLERIEINRMFEAGEISYEQAKELRRFVNHTETIALYE
jgi:monovalent cation/hydrogen antiporter